MTEENGADADEARVGSGDESLSAAFAARAVVIRQMDDVGGWDYFLAESGERIASLAYRYEMSRLRELNDSESGEALERTLESTERVRDAAVDAELAESGALVSRLAAVFASTFDVGVAAAGEEWAATSPSGG